MPATSQKFVPGANSFETANAVLPSLLVSVICGRRVGDRHADLGVGGVHVGLRGTHVWPLADEVGWQAQGQPSRQLEGPELEDCLLRFAREAPG